MAIDVTPETMSAEEIVALSRRHTLYEWSAQNAVDPIPVERPRASTSTRPTASATSTSTAS